MASEGTAAIIRTAGVTSMDSSLAQVASFENAFEAEQARAILEEHGMSAFIDGANANTTLSHVGTALGGVRLFVRLEDLAAAAELLDSFSAGSEKTGPPWFCGNCQEEVDAGFECCWSCGRHREEVEQPFPPTQSAPIPSAEEASDTSELPTVPVDQAANPYVSPRSDRYLRSQIDDDALSDPEAEALLQRAWRASIIGIVLFPPLLHLYSMYLLIQAGMITNDFSIAGRRRYYGAILVNLVAGSISAVAWTRVLG